MTSHETSALEKNRAGKRICLLAYTFYESDNRVMRYAQALVGRGDQVDVIALATDEQQPSFEIIEGVNVHRIQRRQRNEKSKFSYLYRLTRFCAKSSFFLGRLHLKWKYDLIHVHNVPDFLVFSAWFPKLTGAKIILDIHDILPEFFANKFRRPETSLSFKTLKLVELTSARFANHVIISNHLWFDKFAARSMPKERCSVFINHVDLNLFNRKRTRSDGKFILIYHGGLQRHQGLDIAIRAFAKVGPQTPNAEFHIYGGGNMKPEWQALAQTLGLDGRVRFFESRPMREIAEIVANADLGIVAKRADSFGNEAYSTKIMEYMAAGVPAIVSKTKIDSYYFNDSVVRFFESGNENDLAVAMLDLMNNRDRCERLTRNANEYVSRNNWNVKKHEYLRLVDSLLFPAEIPSARLAANSSNCP
ncbi:MAG: glycosyltransferase family 4 protein [Verrucomicrobiales bacterium]|nr:glycosyltransferase family 4 protein [Verrucomicrobiales bacterium]